MFPEESKSSHEEPGRLKKFRLLLVAPAFSLLLLLLAYGLLHRQLPAVLARHAGPDGLGFSSTPMVLLVGSAAAILCFGIGAWCALDFWKHQHWYQTQKLIVVGFFAAGYGIVALLLTTIFLVRGSDPTAAASQSFGLGLLAFLLGFIAFTWIYVKALPVGRMEEISKP